MTNKCIDLTTCTSWSRFFRSCFAIYTNKNSCCEDTGPTRLEAAVPTNVQRNGQKPVHPYMEKDKSLCWTVSDCCPVKTVFPHLRYFSLKWICILHPGAAFLFRTYWLFFPISVQKSVLSAAKEIEKTKSSASSRKFMSC